MTLCTFKPETKLVDAHKLAKEMGCTLQWVIVNGKMKLALTR